MSQELLPSTVTTANKAAKCLREKCCRPLKNMVATRTTAFQLDKGHNIDGAPELKFELCDYRWQILIKFTRVKIFLWRPFCFPYLLFLPPVPMVSFQHLKATKYCHASSPAHPDWAGKRYSSENDLETNPKWNFLKLERSLFTSLLILTFNEAQAWAVPSGEQANGSPQKLHSGA